MSSPTVSVIVPTYNRAGTLARAIRSVLQQTHADFEVIVVDDGSTDETAEVVAGFSDARVRYLYQDNRGAAAARNAGIRAARAALIAFQDSDDEWLADKLDAQLEAFHQHATSPALICGGYLALSERRQDAQYWGPDARMQRGDWQADNLYDFCFITPTWLAPRQILIDAGLFDEQMPNLEDWEMAFRLYRHGPMIALDRPLLVKHGGSASLNFSLDKRILSLQRIIEKHAALWASQPRTLARLHDELGRLLCRSGDTTQGGSHLRRALTLDRRGLSRWLHAAASLGGPAAYGTLRRISQRQRSA